ncbi:hypothetical protein [Comamonas thiooxydans]|nr:hypothetical protein [Comamonas thiooxydans]
MNTLLVSVFVAFIAIGIGAAILGWLGKFGPALTSLAFSIFGMLGTGMLAKTLDTAGAGVPTWLAASGAVAVLLGGGVVVLARRGKEAEDRTPPQPDYAAISQKMLADLNATVAAKKAAHKAR